jgi:lysyl-tRNA synthetase class 1
MHWADVIAKDVMEKTDHPLIATGISPTGILHVGSLREAITGESIRSALTEIGAKPRLIYLIDSFDPLRRRYEFLPEEYEKYVNMPICKIPCPCGKHDNYAHHFIQPFLDVIQDVGVQCEVIWTHQLYEQGKFANAIDLSFKRREQVIQILKEVTGRDLKSDFSPYNPLCEECGRYTNPILESYSYPYVEYQCKCGHHGKADVRKAEGKLVWRLEWPAKWTIFGTSIEPFGKDHAAAGGSYDSGKRLVTEVFGGQAPYPVPYEFVQLKGVGQMHKSTGSPVTGIDAIGMTPAEVLNYMFLRVNPQKAIDYDSGMGILDLADEYDRMERLYFVGGATDNEKNDVRAYEIAQHNNVPQKLPLQVPYRHLVNVVQMADDFDGVLSILKRTEDLSEANDFDIERLKRRCACVRYWLNGFAPEVVKFSVSKTMPAVQLNADEKAYLGVLAKNLPAVDWQAESINNVVSEAAKTSPLGAKKGFQALYKVLITRDSGPRLGTFLATMDKDFVVGRLSEASQ